MGEASSTFLDSLCWVDDVNDHYNGTVSLSKSFTRVPLARLVEKFSEADNPTDATGEILRVSYLLILSNHIEKAQELLTKLFELANDYIDGKTADIGIAEVFWQAHPALPRLANATSNKNRPWYLINDLPGQQWRWFAMCTREWTPARDAIEPPEDPHEWRKTDEAGAIAACARSLAKPPGLLEYPPEETMREALDAAQKLYAQPEMGVDEYIEFVKPLASDQKYKMYHADGTRIRRSSYLVPRRLAVELAIRLGALQAAADIMSQGLKRDGLCVGGTLNDYLLLPGIYDVLPLLAARGKDGSPYFIPEEDADGIVRELSLALKRRDDGRVRVPEPTEDPAGWRELLDRLVAGAWQMHGKEYRSRGVMSAEEILYPPATEEEIEAAEAEVGELPADLKDMVRIANGFKGGWHFFGGGMRGIYNIGLHSESEWENVSICLEDQGVRQEGASGRIFWIEAGPDCDDYEHLIVPPESWKANVVHRDVAEGEYAYGYTSHWMEGIEYYKSVRHFVLACVQELEERIKRGEVEEFDPEA